MDSPIFFCLQLPHRRSTTNAFTLALYRSDNLVCEKTAWRSGTLLGEILSKIVHCSNDYIMVKELHKWSTIWSVILPVINKRGGPRRGSFVISRVCLHNELEDKKSYHLLNSRRKNVQASYSSERWRELSNYVGITRTYAVQFYCLINAK